MLISQILIFILLAFQVPDGNFDPDSLDNKITKLPVTEQIDANIELAKHYNLISFEKSFFYAKKAILLAKHTGNYEREVEALNTIAICHYSRSQYSKALQYFEESLNICETHDLKQGMAKSLNGIGVIYKNIGDLNKALENYQKALKIFTEIDDQNAISTALGNIGNIYKRWKNYDEAIEAYNQSLVIAEKVNNLEAKSLAINNRSLLYVEIGKYDEAILGFKQSLDIEILRNNLMGIARSYQNIGDVYYHWGSYEMAIDYFKKSLEIEGKYDNKMGEIGALISIGEAFNKMGNNSDAIYYYNLSLKKAEKIGALNELKDIYSELANVYDETGDTKKSYDYYKEHIKYKDSIFNVESQETFANLKTVYETEQREQEIEILEKDNQISQEKINSQQIIIYTVISGGFVVFVFLIFIFRLYRQKIKANKLLDEQKEEIETQRDLITVQKNEITDSILYAENIQMAILPPEDLIISIIPECFILFKPRNIVSGDFYWLGKHNDLIYIAVADCTGHGVPGALMSMLGMAYLNEIIMKNRTIAASEILNDMRDKIIISLRQSNEPGKTRDGMDISLCVINTEKQEIQYSGANNPIYIVYQQNLEEIKPDKMPIGIHYHKNISFTDKVIKYKNNTLLYMFSDGFADQFGGASGKKYKYKMFKEILLELSAHDLEKQKVLLENSLINWMGSDSYQYDQVDDILVIGVKLNNE
ncbi:MAG: tetratricopeptide repeat protein [Bacteroidota bacterium]